MTVKDNDMTAQMHVLQNVFISRDFFFFSFFAVMNQLALVQVLLVLSLPTWVIAMKFCSFDIRIHECDVTLETSLLLQVATVFL